MTLIRVSISIILGFFIIITTAAAYKNITTPSEKDDGYAIIFYMVYIAGMLNLLRDIWGIHI